MSESDFGFHDLDVINDHFPDGVDIFMVDRPMWIEVCLDANMSIFDYLDEPDPSRFEPLNKVRLDLVEIEPETGIYAAMSPVTRRVYVYVSPEYAG
jgi:hypothetical protein